MLKYLVTVSVLFAACAATSSQYISYTPGTDDIIITIPHGGSIRPPAGSWPTRKKFGCWVSGACVYTHNCGRESSKCKAGTSKDLGTMEIGLVVADELRKKGLNPHVVVNNVHRSKLDPNREQQEGTFDVPGAVAAYDQYMSYIEQAQSRVQNAGVLFDIHGQAHTEHWVELGYGISKYRLNDDNFSMRDSTVRALWERRCDGDQDCGRCLLRGPASFGRLLSRHVKKDNVTVVPSPDNKSPGNGSYFNGGYTVKTYGSRARGKIDAIQVEVPSPQRQQNTREEFARDLAAAIALFYEIYYT